MIVLEPPYDLVALCADSEMKAMLETLIERGQERRSCTRPFRWRSLRDPRRDTVWREPEGPLTLFLKMNCRFLIAWDHHGSGVEDRRSTEMEESVVQRLTAVGIDRERILAIAFDPEIEISFRTAWSRIKQVVAEERGAEPPLDESILLEARRRNPRLRIPDDFYAALAKHPKELFEALVLLLRLRKSAPLYTRIGGRVSLRALKSEEALARIAKSISTWFPPVADLPDR